MNRLGGLHKRFVLIGALAAALVGATATYAGLSQQQGLRAITKTPSTAKHASAGSGSFRGGHRVTGQTYSTMPAPTPKQFEAAKEGLRESKRVPAPNRNTANPTTQTGPPVRSPGSPQVADATYKRFGYRSLPTASIAGGQGFSSFVNEPSVAHVGKNVFMTGNWYAGYSRDNGSTWTFLNPFTLFGSGFCCDQVAIYDKTHDRVFWLLQFDNHLVVANAPTGGLGSWCYYNFFPGDIGQASTTALDFNDVMVGTKFLYFTTNIFPTSGYGSEIVRLPLEQMSTCSGFGFNYYSQLDSFSWRLVQGSNDRAYWGSDWDPTGARPNGTSFRLFWWDESSTTLFWNNYNIDPFAFYVRNSGQNCASQDGVVKNWCQYADSRVLGAYRGSAVLPLNNTPTFYSGVIGFSMNAAQGGFAAFPYTVREYFRESDLAYLGHTNLYATSFAIQFLSLAPNSKGHVGGTYSWGGGTGTTHNYPGTAALVEDDITPDQPWTNDFFQPGAGNTCTYSGLYRWGDYLTTRPNDAADTTWIGTGFKEVHNCGTTGSYTQPVLLEFGRARDTGDFNRWATK